LSVNDIMETVQSYGTYEDIFIKKSSVLKCGKWQKTVKPWKWRTYASLKHW